MIGLAEHIICDDGVATAFGVGLTVPLTGTFCVIAPVEEQVIFPDGVPDAEALNRTYIVVVLTFPPTGINEMDPLNPLPEVTDTSKPAGAVMSRLATRFVPDTVNVCSAEGVPAQVVKGVNVPFTVMMGAPPSISVSVDVLFPGFGSVVPAGAVTVAVFTRLPEALGEIVHVAVNMAEPPTGILTTALILLTPEAGPVAPPAYAAVHVIPVIAAGKLSVTIAPVTSLGPPLVTIIV